MLYNVERRVAIGAVIKACRICIDFQSERESQDIITKKDNSPVTIADFGAQAVICHELKKTFSRDPIVGEEDSSELRTEKAKILRAEILRHVNAVTPDIDEEEMLELIDSGNHCGGTGGRFWTLDPIDGTKGFLRGDQYAVALALIENGEVVLGVLGCPSLPLDVHDPNSIRGCVISAVKGQGSILELLDGGNATKVRVSFTNNAKDALFCESVESEHSSHGDSERIAKMLGVEREFIRIDSQCKYAVIARGDASIYLRLPTKKDYEEKIWDHAAGSIIVKEAGGKVTDIFGKDLDFSLGRTLFNNTGILATNGTLHNSVASSINEVFSKLE